MTGYEDGSFLSVINQLSAFFLPYRPLSLTSWLQTANPLRMRMVETALLATEGGLSSEFSVAAIGLLFD